MTFTPHKIRVGVLRGGPSPEYDVSLRTGGAILANLPDEYEPLDIFISKDGVWHIGGLEKDPHKILETIDVAVNAMHGAYGEDGTVQNLLQEFNIPYTGSNSLASAMGMNKVMSKNVFRQAGLKTPHYILVESDGDEQVNRDKMIDKIDQSLPYPMIIKPINSGSSLGISFVDRKNQLKEALQNSFEHSPKLIIEEYINGKEATCGVIEDFRGSPFYSLLPVEVARKKGGYFHDYDSKYGPLEEGLESRYTTPGNFTGEEKEQIQKAAALIHQALGLRHYSRSDFIIHPKRGVLVLEVNTLPEITHRSSFVKSLEALGSNLKEFLSHLLSKTLGK